MSGAVILFLIFMAVMLAVRYVTRRPDLMARGFMWLLQRRQRKARRTREREAERRERTYRQRRGASSRGRREPIIPREYAQDVEYVEITVTERVVETVYTRVESQVSDAEWEELPPRKQ